MGIPLVGLIVRSILVIPQIVVLAIIGFVMYFAVLISWAPVLTAAGWRRGVTRCSAATSG